MRYQHWMKLSLVIMGAALLLLGYWSSWAEAGTCWEFDLAAELAKLAIVSIFSHWLWSKGELLAGCPTAAAVHDHRGS